MSPFATVRRRWVRAGLRDRVLALVLALLLVSGGILVAATTISLRHYLVTQLDQRVVEARDTYAQSLDDPDHDVDDVDGFDTQGQAPGTVGAHVDRYGRLTGGVVQGDGRLAALGPSDAAALAVLPLTPSPTTVELPVLGEYRLALRRDPDGDLLVAGLPTRSVDATVRDLALVEIAVVTAVLLATAVIGRRLVQVSLQPLQDLTRTATEVSDLPLDAGDVVLHSRVPDPAPGTEIGEVAEAFNHMLDHVSGAFAARHRSESQLRRFVADASHELRTPLAVIRSHAEHARRVGLDLPADTSRELDRIVAESTRMGALVDNLLLLARLDAGRASLVDEVDLTLLVIDVVDGARLTAPDHRWSLDLPEQSVLVRGEADELRRAVANVVGNAGRHTPAGTTVRVVVRRGGDDVEILVEDDGPGIQPVLLSRVFDRFVRGDDARSRAAGSTGLGLAIAQAITHAHGGTISVRSVAGATAFVIRLPAEQARSADLP